MARISYGPTTPWLGQGFSQLHGVLRQLVDDGPPPGGEAMVDRSVDVAGRRRRRRRPAARWCSSGSDRSTSSCSGRCIRRSRRCSACTGWTGGRARPGLRLPAARRPRREPGRHGRIRAGLAGHAGLGRRRRLRRVQQEAGGRSAAGRARPPPGVLPSRATLAVDGGDELLDATNNAGLVWSRPLTDGVLQPGAPVLYHVWRADLGDVEAPASPGADDFEALTASAPILAGGEPPLGLASGRPRAPRPVAAVRPPVRRSREARRVVCVPRRRHRRVRAPFADEHQRRVAPVGAGARAEAAGTTSTRRATRSSMRAASACSTSCPRRRRRRWRRSRSTPTTRRCCATPPIRLARTLTPAERESVIGLRVRWRWTEAQSARHPTPGSSACTSTPPRSTP